jgi:hypothetical protein
MAKIKVALLPTKSRREPESSLKHLFSLSRVALALIAHANACSLPTVLRHETDRRNEEIARLDAILGSGATVVSAPLNCLNNAHKLLTLLKEEHYRGEGSETMVRCIPDYNCERG